MSATLRQRCQTSLGAGSRCKGTTKFADMQILSEKSFRSFKSSKGNRAISVKRTAQCTYCLGFRDDTKIAIYVRWGP